MSTRWQNDIAEQLSKRKLSLSPVLCTAFENIEMPTTGDNQQTMEAVKRIATIAVTSMLAPIARAWGMAPHLQMTTGSWPKNSTGANLKVYSTLNRIAETWQRHNPERSTVLRSVCRLMSASNALGPKSAAILDVICDFATVSDTHRSLCGDKANDEAIAHLIRQIRALKQ